MNPDLDLPEPMAAEAPDLAPATTATQTPAPTAIAPDPVDPGLVLTAVALAALLAASVALAGRSSERKLKERTCLFGIALGWVVGTWWLGLWPSGPARQVREIFVLIVFPAVLTIEYAGILLMDWLGTTAPRIVWLPRVLIAAVAGPVLLMRTNYFWASVGSTPLWTAGHALMVFGSMTILLLAEWLLLTRLAARRPSRSLVISLALACAGSGVTVMLSGYLSGGLLGLPLAAAVAGAALVFAPRQEAPRSWIGPGVVGLFALLVMGHFFAGLDLAKAIVLFASPLLVWIGEAPIVRGWSGWRRGIVVLIMATVPVAAVVALAAR